MVSHVVWFLVVLGGALAVFGATWVAQRATPEPGQPVSVRASLATLVGTAVAIVILAALWRVHAIAKADATAVAKLVHDRGTTLTGILSVVTTMGDLVPSFLIAGVISLVLFQRTRRWTAWILPLVVLVQVAIQTVVIDVANDPTIAAVRPGITVGGSDGIPSGAMARLLSIFLLAALLWRPYDVKAARRFTEFGVALVFIELLTRLYLGRHFLADIAAGLLLGILLTVFFGSILYFVDMKLTAKVDRAPPHTN